jgi:hypothetical protein
MFLFENRKVKVKLKKLLMDIKKEGLQIFYQNIASL